LANRFNAATNEWLADSPIESGAGETLDSVFWDIPADIALDPSGKGIVIWRQSNGTQFDIWTNRFE